MNVIKRWLKTAFEVCVFIVGGASLLALIVFMLWWDKVRFVL